MNGTKPTLLWKVGRALCRIFTTLWFDLKIYGRDNVPRTGGVLLVSNHQSYLDPILLAVQLNRTMSFMARSGLFDNRFFAWLIRKLNAFPIRQGEGDVSALRETVRRLQEGHLLNIFPEGSRTDDGEILPIRSGVALVIRKAAVPVVPAAIDGAYKAWSKHNKIFRRHPVRVLYGKPMMLHDLKPNQIVQRIEQELRSLLSELRAIQQREPGARR